jgi:hypothetical protein
VRSIEPLIFWDRQWPYETLGASVFAIVDIDLGSSCARPDMTDQEKKDLLSGKKTYSRATECDAPAGVVQVRYRTGTSAWEAQVVPLKFFFAANDGHVRVPMLMHRRSSCRPMDTEVTLTGVQNFGDWNYVIRPSKKR